MSWSPPTPASAGCCHGCLTSSRPCPPTPGGQRWLHAILTCGRARKLTSAVQVNLVLSKSALPCCSPARMLLNLSCCRSAAGQSAPQQPFNSASGPEPCRVLIAAAAGLDGEAAVLAAARLSVMRDITAYQALIRVSHRRLALQLKVPCSVV